MTRRPASKPLQGRQAGTHTHKAIFINMNYCTLLNKPIILLELVAWHPRTPRKRKNIGRVIMAAQILNLMRAFSPLNIYFLIATTTTSTNIVVNSHPIAKMRREKKIKKGNHAMRCCVFSTEFKFREMEEKNSISLQFGEKGYHF